MTKKILSTMLLSSLLLAPMVSMAATDVTPASANKGKIEFKDNDTGGGETDPDQPVDPGDGGDGGGGTDPVDPGPGDGGQSTTGALRFVYAPSLDFGDNNKLTFKGQNYYALFPKVTPEGAAAPVEKPTFVEIIDERGGAKGWQLTASNNGEFTSADGKKFNATLSFTNMTIVSNSGFTNIDEHFPVLPARDTETVIGSGTQIANAVQGKGYGGWSVRIGDVINGRTTGQGQDGTETTGEVDETKKDRNAAIKLHIPQGQIIDSDAEYTTDLVWTLTDAA